MTDQSRLSVELCEIRKTYGDFVAVDRISLQVPAGSIFGLLGPNGAGKTTTIRMLMDIIAPDSGEVRLFGRARSPRDLQRIGYLPEERGLYRKMTIHDHLVFLGELHGLKRGEASAAAHHWLKKVELAEWGKRKVEELSKGMQQKVQLAGTILHEPDILILDEPFSGLDPINQGLFKDLLAQYRDDGKTVLFSTHVMEQAEKLCDRICLISRGRAILEGKLAEIKGRYGGNTYHLEVGGGVEQLPEVPGVEEVIRHQGGFHLLLEPDADASQVLEKLVGSVEVRGFRSEEPDLETIFIKAVHDAAQER